MAGEEGALGVAVVGDGGEVGVDFEGEGCVYFYGRAG